MKSPQTSKARHLHRLITSSVAVATVVLGLLAPSTSASAATGFVHPVSGHVADVVGGCPQNSRPNHEGVDINGNGGSAVYAAAAGTVSTAINSNATSGYGTQVVITHADGYTTRYAHMIYNSLQVRAGDSVAQGQRIGTVGSTGNSTGAHMHLEIKRNGANITNQYFRCLQPNVTALTPMGTGGASGSSSPVNADFNNDGRADIVAVSTTGQMTAYNGNGAGGWSTDTLGSGWGTTRAIIHGDFDGDRKGDLVAARTDGTLWFYKGSGANSFTGSQVGHNWNTMRLISGGADFNNDGRADIVAVGTDNNLYLYPGNGAGGFSGATQIGNGWSDFDTIIAGDFGSDKRGDILARNSAGQLIMYPGKGSGFGTPYQVGHGWGGMTALTGGTDYGLDGFADVIARDATGVLWLYPGLGGSGFGSRIQVGHGWNIHRLIS